MSEQSPSVLVESARTRGGSVKYCKDDIVNVVAKLEGVCVDTGRAT